MAVINGTSIYGRVDILPEAESNSAIPIISFDLPPYNRDGMIESYEIKKIIHELISLNINSPDIIDAQRIIGYKINFVCNFNQFITGNDLYDKIKLLFDYAKAGKRIIFYPRKDLLNRNFEVNLANESLELGTKGGAMRNKYHRLPVIIFRTKYLEPDLKWFPPDPEPVSLAGGGSFAVPFEGSM